MLREIVINSALNGFIVKVGCQHLVYTDREKLVRDLNEYLKRPEETEKRILENECYNTRHIDRSLPDQTEERIPFRLGQVGRVPTNLPLP